MSLALPVHITEPVWRAIRDEVIAPARAEAIRGQAPTAAGLSRLADSWAQARPDAGRLVVWLDPDLAGILAGLLDERPELAGHLLS